MASLEFYMDIDEYKRVVLETLEELHYEKGRGKSFSVDEIAERAGIPPRLILIVLENLRRDGVVGKRRHGRYYIKEYHVKPHILLSL